MRIKADKLIIHTFIKSKINTFGILRSCYIKTCEVNGAKRPVPISDSSGLCISRTHFSAASGVE